MIVNASLTYSDVIATIRELVQDLTPVSCFTITKQGFKFSADSDKVTLTNSDDVTEDFTFADNPKFSALNRSLLLSEQEYAIALLPDYAQNEISTLILPVSNKATDTAYTVKRAYYFSEETINKLIFDYLAQHQCSCSSTLYTYFNSYCRGNVDINARLNGACYTELQKLCLWVAYWLIDTRRMQMSSVNFLIKTQTGDSSCQDVFTNTNRNVTTKIGDTFTVTENQVSDGSGADNFTALWGDADNYLAKLQLYFRNLLEKKYTYYGLRDNVIVSTTFCLEKQWEPYSYVDTIRLHTLTKDIFQ